MPGTTLAGWLRALDDSALAALLRSRPDLAVPPPADSTVLATRATIAASIRRACEDLDAFTLTVLEALVLADADQRPVPKSTVDALLGASVPPHAAAAALDRLRERALAWGSDEAISVAAAARQAVPPYPGGLGRRSQSLDANTVRTALQDLDTDQRRILEALAAGPPIGTSRDATADADPNSPVQRLIAAGLLIRADEQTVELPREVGMALRADNPMGALPLAEPALATARQDRSIVDSRSATAVLELLRHNENLVSLWGEQPAPALRSGGLGVREVRRVAKALDVDETHATLILEVAAAAGLVGMADREEPLWAPTTQADLWLNQPPAQRWATLAAAWLDMPRLPGLSGARDDHGRALAVLAEELRRPLAARDRRWVLDVFAAMPPGIGVVDQAELAAVLAWRAPRRGGRLRDELVDWTIREATAVGVLAVGALATAGRALLGGDRRAAVAAMAQALPEPVGHVLVQADLTIVAPGPLDPDLGRELALVADVESAGGATVYRVAEGSIRRALDAGRTAAELQDLFAAHSTTGVPQALSYMIDDVARRHGRLRAGAAGCFLRCDDPALVSEVLADRRIADGMLRRIAPTVLVSPRPLSEVLTALRATGYAPVAEGQDGQVIDLRQSGHRVSYRRRPATPALPADLDPERAEQLVRQIRAGDHAAAARPHDQASDSAETLALLQQAVQRRRSVWIGYVDSYGVASRRIVEPVSVAGGVLEGFDRAQGSVRRFPLHRITAVADA
jgi:Helicase conserved C-terminal domain